MRERKTFLRIVLVMVTGLVSVGVALAEKPGPEQVQKQIQKQIQNQVPAQIQKQGAPPNILLVTLDTTRADHLGAYGWKNARTPHLDALAKRGVVFERVDSSAPITLPSHASLMTGLFPPRHGVRDNGTFSLGAEQTTLAEQLRERGYDTAAVVAAVVLARSFGLDQGFRVYDDAMPAEDLRNAASERTAEEVTAAALKVLPRLKAPWFLWVHYYDPHVTYSAPEEWVRGQKGPAVEYDAEIAFMDHHLGRLLEKVGPTALVAAIGDHGEMLGDHGEATHGALLHRGARRVPFILAGPGLPARRIDSLVRSVDVAPTLLSLAGAEASDSAAMDGVDLSGLLRGVSGDPEASILRLSYTESFLPYYAYRWHPLRSLSDGRWLWVDGTQGRLFDLEADPREVKDVASAQAKQSQIWSNRLAELRDGWGEGTSAPAGTQVDADTRAKLASLGYVGGGGGGSYEGLPDPYSMVDIAERLHEIAPLVAEGNCEPVRDDLREILRRNRDNLPALNMAGICLMGEKKFSEALPYFTHAVEVHPASSIARSNLAGCELQLGHRDKAETLYWETVELDPTQPQAVANLAKLLREKGQLGESLAVLEAGMSAGPSQPAWNLERGMILAAQGKVEPALADFETVLAVEPEHLSALENAARAAYLAGLPQRSSQHYQRLLERLPERGDLWKTLAAIRLEALGDVAGGRAALLRARALERDPAEQALLDEMLASLGGSS